MRTTLNVDDDLMRRARELTGIFSKTDLVRAGLEALVQRASAQQLARLGGTEPDIRPIRRRREVS